MKKLSKTQFSSILILVILALNFGFSYIYKTELKDLTDSLTIYKVLKKSFLPPTVYLFLLLFSKDTIKFKHFSVFILFYMSIEFTFRYFNNISIIDYNYLFGSFLGLLIVYFIYKLKEKAC